MLLSIDLLDSISGDLGREEDGHDQSRLSYSTPLRPVEGGLDTPQDAESAISCTANFGCWQKLVQNNSQNTFRNDSKHMIL